MNPKQQSPKPRADFSVSEFQCVTISAPSGDVGDHGTFPRRRPRQAAVMDLPNNRHQRAALPLSLAREMASPISLGSVSAFSTSTLTHSN